MSIYQTIKGISKRKKITQKEIAEGLSVTETQVTNYLNGRSKITADQIPLFAKLLRVSISELFEEPGTSGETSSYHDVKCDQCAEKDAEIFRLKSKLYEIQDKYTLLLEQMHVDKRENKQCG